MWHAKSQMSDNNDKPYSFSLPLTSLKKPKNKILLKCLSLTKLSALLVPVPVLVPRLPKASTVLEPRYASVPAAFPSSRRLPRPARTNSPTRWGKSLLLNVMSRFDRPSRTCATRPAPTLVSNPWMLSSAAQVSCTLPT